MARFARFDVVVVPFPYTDRLAEKRRPAIVVSAPILQADHNLVWLAMVTSADNLRWDSDIDISNPSSTGLPNPSRIRPAKIATVDASRILRRIGRLSAKDVKELKEMFRVIVGL